MKALRAIGQTAVSVAFLFSIPPKSTLLYTFWTEKKLVISYDIAEIFPVLIINFLIFFLKIRNNVHIFEIPSNWLRYTSRRTCNKNGFIMLVEQGDIITFSYLFPCQNIRMKICGRFLRVSARQIQIRGKKLQKYVSRACRHTC